MPLSEDSHGTRTIETLSVRGGVNERNRPWHLAEDQVAATKGWDSTKDGQRRKRSGVQTVFCGDGYPGGITIQRNALDFDYSPVFDFSFKDSIVAIYGGHVYRIDGDEDSGDYTVPDAGTPDYASTDVPSCITFGFSYDGNEQKVCRTLWFCDSRQHPSGATATPLTFIRDLDGVIWNGTHNYAPLATTFFQGRLWIANDQWATTAASGSYIGFNDTWDFRVGSDLRPSAPFDTSDFSHPAVLVEPGVGGDIRHLYPLRLDDPAMLVFKDSAIAVFQPRWGSGGGYLAAAGETLDTVASKLKLLNSEIGCKSPRTVVEIPSESGTDIMFLASDGHVRRLQRVTNDIPAGAGFPVTYNCPDLMDRINLNWVEDACAAFWDNKYVLSVPLDEATANSHLIIIDTVKNVVLSVEPLKCSGLATISGFKENKAAPVLVGQYAVTTTDSLTTGATEGYHLFRLFDDDSYLDPDGAQISAEEDSRGYTFGTLRQKKRWQTFGVMAETCTNATGTVDVEYAVNAGDFTSLGSLVFPQATSARELHILKIACDDIDPDYMIQFRVKNSDSSRLSVVYTEARAKLIPEEQDNSIS